MLINVQICKSIGGLFLHVKAYYAPRKTGAGRVRHLEKSVIPCIFWQVAMRPGKPLAFGAIESVPLFVLPDNSVSAMVSFGLIRKSWL